MVDVAIISLLQSSYDHPLGLVGVDGDTDHGVALVEFAPDPTLIATFGAKRSPVMPLPWSAGCPTDR